MDASGSGSEPARMDIYSRAMRRVHTARQIERNECGLPCGVCLNGRCQNTHNHVGRHHCDILNCGANSDSPIAQGQLDSAQILLRINLDSEGDYKFKVCHNVVVSASLGSDPSSGFMTEMIHIKADLEKIGESITRRIHPEKRCLESEDDAPSPNKRRCSVARGLSEPEEDAPAPYHRPRSVAQGRSDLPSSAWRDWHPGDPFDDDGNFIGPQMPVVYPEPTPRPSTRPDLVARYQERHGDLVARNQERHGPRLVTDSRFMNMQRGLPDESGGDQSPDEGHNLETYGHADPESDDLSDADQRGGTVLGGPGTRSPSLAELCAFGDKAFADSIAVRKERRKAREERILAHPKKKGGKGAAGGEGG